MLNALRAPAANAARWRGYAGLAAAIIPCAIIVHLSAEVAAVGRAGVNAGFLARHGYFGVVFAAAALWFATTVGIGQSRSERRRRCGLLKANLHGARGTRAFVTLVGANLGFFALTQLIEGVPVVTGAAAWSLSIALAGSIAAAALMVFFGHALAVATIDAIIGSLPDRRTLRAAGRRTPAISTPRRAATTYSLLRPNRPPPTIFQF